MTRKPIVPLFSKREAVVDGHVCAAANRSIGSCTAAERQNVDLGDDPPQHRVRGENLYSAMGQTEEGRYVIAFFIHKQDGRALIISARSMDEAEKKRYGRN